MLKVLPVLCVVSALAAPALDPQAASAARKLDLIQSGKAQRGAVYVFTSAELNAWAKQKLPAVVPEGVRNPRLVLENGAATATALVNFLKVRHGQGLDTNWFISKLIDGEKFVKVNARIQSAHGRAAVYLQRVEISGLAVSGSTLDFLIRNFFLPLYPNAKINEPFDLSDNIDHIDVRPSDARAYIRR